MRSTRRQSANSGVPLAPNLLALRLAGSSRRHLCLRVGRSFGLAAEVLVIEPDEHAAGVYRGDDAVPSASLRRSVDYAASEVGLLGKLHCRVPFLGTCTIEARPEHYPRLNCLIYIKAAARLPPKKVAHVI